MHVGEHTPCLPCGVSPRPTERCVPTIRPTYVLRQERQRWWLLGAEERTGVATLGALHHRTGREHADKGPMPGANGSLTPHATRTGVFVRFFARPMDVVGVEVGGGSERTGVAVAGVVLGRPHRRTDRRHRMNQLGTVLSQEKGAVAAHGGPENTDALRGSTKSPGLA